MRSLVLFVTGASLTFAVLTACPSPPPATAPDDAGSGDAGGCASACAGGETRVNGQCVGAACAGPVDFQTDVSNCGQCGEVCPQPVHASARCTGGKCGRSPCQAGYYDLDGTATFGCETTCQGKVCIDGQGNSIWVTQEPVPENGDAWRALSSGTSHGGLLQTSPGFTNFATLGEPTPVLGFGTMEATSPSFRLRGGFNAALTKTGHK